MNQSIKNGFCPKCGALMRENVCQSCGFSVNMDDSTNSYKNEEVKYSHIPQPTKKNKTGLIVGIIIGGIALVLLIGVVLVIGAYVVFNYSVTKTPDLAFSEVENDDYYYDDSYDDYYYEYFDELFDEEENEAEDYFEKYGNTIVEPEMEGQQWNDIWDSPENTEK